MFVWNLIFLLSAFLIPILEGTKNSFLQFIHSFVPFFWLPFFPISSSSELSLSFWFSYLLKCFLIHFFLFFLGFFLLYLSHSLSHFFSPSFSTRICLSHFLIVLFLNDRPLSSIILQNFCLSSFLYLFFLFFSLDSCTPGNRLSCVMKRKKKSQSNNNTKTAKNREKT